MFRGRRAMSGGPRRFGSFGGGGGGNASRGFGRGRSFSGSDRGGWNRGRGHFPNSNDRYVKPESNDVYDGGYRSEDQPFIKKEDEHHTPEHRAGPSFNARPERAPSKMGRIIIRNLPFTTKDEDLRNLMGKCGKIVEVRIPTKEDGKMRGFAFVQFQSVNSAELAIKMFNATNVKDRPIAVDWAVAKSRYEQAQAEQQTIKSETGSEARHNESGPEKAEDDEEPAETPVEDESNEAESDSKSSDGSVSDKEDDKESQESGENPDGVRKKKPRHPKKPSDVEEGRTLFVRNIPFDADGDTFREAFTKFGRVKYALLCHHSDSGQPKGSGFVQFLEKIKADACISRAASADGIVLSNRKLEVCVAENAKQRRKAERVKHEKVPKDNRNLSLLNAGAVTKEDPEFTSMSQNDARKRSMLDKRKADSLKNLHMFVSQTRLSMHNIPKNVDNQSLRQIIADASGIKKYAVQKCLIMRDMEHLDSQGVGKSRGFGFVDFRTHEDAAKAIAAVNNNPNIFRSDKRPIVEYALENKAALLKKQRRLEHSQAKLQMLRKQASSDNSSGKRQSKKADPAKTTEVTAKQTKFQKPLAIPVPRQRNPSPQKLTAKLKQAEEVSAEKKPMNKKRKKAEVIEASDDFSRIVENYKKKLFDGERKSGTKLSRWFDE